MKFNDTSSAKDGLIQHCEFLLDFPVGTISGDSTLLAHFTRIINIYYHKIAMHLWRSSGSWEFDDSNNTDFPIATTNLVEGQRDYALPTDAIKIYRVQVKDLDGKYYRLDYLDEQRVGSGLLNEDASAPTHYYLLDDSLFLYPKPTASNVTLSNGLQLWLAREITEFTTADTTKQPGFPKMYHHIPALCAAYLYASIKNMTMKGELEKEIKTVAIPDLIEFEDTKNRDERVVIQPRQVSYN